MSCSRPGHLHSGRNSLEAFFHSSQGADSGRIADMSNTDVAELLKLPAEERLRLVELIWESLAANPSDVPLSDAHRAVIDERIAEHERNPDDVLSRDEVLTRARRG